MDDIIVTCIGLLEQHGVSYIAYPDYYNRMQNALYDIICDEVDDASDIDSAIEIAICTYVGGVIPERSETRIIGVNTANVDVAMSLVLSQQGDQRSDEWFAERQNMITASNAWKVMGTTASRNSLVWEKIGTAKTGKSGTGNIESTTHWGERYEQVAVQLYERDTGCDVEMVGCIKHPLYSFIGASPDGIVPKLGRGLEIKCVVSREITGIPTHPYWVQMQWQAEVMGLDEIDFLECKFEEYDSEESFLSDGTFHTTEDGQPKGMMQHFHSNDGTYYVYAPLDLSATNYEQWCIDTVDNECNATWVQTRWWKAVSVSCVTVKRQSEWFAEILPSVSSLWDDVLYARKNGGDQYKPAVRNIRKAIPKPTLDVVTIPLYIPSDEEEV